MLDPAHNSDLNLDADTRFWFEQRQIESILTIPLFIGTTHLGSLRIHSTRDAQWQQAEIELAQVLSNQIVLAVQLTRLAEEAKQAAIAREREQAAQARAEELATANAALSRSISQLTLMGEIGGFLDTIAIESIHVSGALSSAIFLHDRESDRLVNCSHVMYNELLDLHTDPQQAVFPEPIPASECLAWRQIGVDRQIFWVDFQSLDSIDCPQLQAWHDLINHRYVAAIPMLESNEVVGFIALAFAPAIAVAAAQAKLNLCQVLAQQAALAVKLTHLSAEAQLSTLLAETQPDGARATRYARANIHRDAVATRSRPSDDRHCQRIYPKTPHAGRTTSTARTPRSPPLGVVVAPRSLGRPRLVYSIPPYDAGDDRSDPDPR